jgi:Tol biopolymer transport system component/predicted Ser/Thr protein kinase
MITPAMDQLSVGSMLGPYRIEGLLGAGGMGRVYRASDTRLDRTVAIKTSDDRFSERFTREARTISALNHPHICTLFDVGPDYLVMELIDGPTLADRLLSGPLPLDEALEIALQIADALDAAHEKGIVHRDLKPANIKISANGDVKVLDFGLAKRMDGKEAGTELTQVGAVLGTSGYMAPEQLRGDAVDKRADIWAFGVVLCEMLTGERPGVSGLRDAALNAVLASSPRWPRIPSHVQRLIRRCIAKDPRDRLRDIGDVRPLLEHEPSAVEAAAKRSPSRRVVVATLVGGAGVTALGAWGWLRAPTPAPRERMRFTAMLPTGARLYQAAVIGSSLALSPDGRSLVVAATDNQGRRLYLRKIDELTASPLSGTEGAASPFFSPDGRWIGFFADGRLRRVPADGGAPVDIAEAAGAPVGASWGPDDRIVFTCGWRSPLYMTSASGGGVKVVAALTAGDSYMRDPEFLPDGRTVLLDGNDSGHRVCKALDLASGRRVMITEGATPRYAANGRLLVGRGTTLLAAPFDAKTLTLAGQMVPEVEGVALSTGGVQHYAVARNGTLAHAVGTSLYALVLVDLASGSEQRVVDEQPRFCRPRFALDGRRLASGVAVPRGTGFSSDNVWIYDLANSGPGTPVTTNGGTAPIWSSDGTELTFAGDTAWTKRVPSGLYTTRLGEGADERQIAPLTVFHRPIGWMPDGLLVEITTEDGEFRIELMTSTGDRRLVVNGINGRVSPDRRALAYVSDRSGRDVVYVTPLRDGSTQRQIAEGNDPAWGPGGSVYYWTGDRLMATTVDATTGMRVAAPRVMADLPAPYTGGDYDISPDGRTLAFVRPADLSHGREIVVGVNWLT